MAWSWILDVDDDDNVDHNDDHVVDNYVDGNDDNVDKFITCETKVTQVSIRTIDS